MAKKQSPSSHALEAIHLDPKKPVKDPTLKAAIAIWNGIAAHGPHAIYPKDLPPDTVRAALVEHLAARKEYRTAGTAQKSAITAVKTLRSKAEKKLTRLEQLLGNAYPEGN